MPLRLNPGLVNAGRRKKSERRAGEREPKGQHEEGRRGASCHQKKSRKSQETSKDRVCRLLVLARRRAWRDEEKFLLSSPEIWSS
jgi:hypothetical protein